MAARSFLRTVLSFTFVATFLAACGNYAPRPPDDLEAKRHYSQGFILGAGVRNYNGDVTQAADGRAIPVTSFNSVYKSPADTTEKKQLKALIEAQRDELAAREDARAELATIVADAAPKGVLLDTAQARRIFIGTTFGLPN